MLYWLSAYSDLWFPLNIFKYITFRLGGAALTALVIGVALGPAMIRLLRARKIGQTQRKDAPSTHLSKEGTPTMGGLLILLSTVVSTVLWARVSNPYVWLLIGVVLALGGVGFYDDYLKLTRKDPRGAPSSVKLAVQLAVAFAVVAFLAAYPPNAQFLTQLYLPYTPDLYLDLGWIYFVLAMLMVVGSSNAVNLTDGLDGLATGNVVTCALAYLVFAYAAGHAKISGYLNIVSVPGAGEISVFLGALIGGCLGFLWYNSYPAEVFMGDTSSLFLGGVIATVALITKQELILPLAGGIFVVETLSVLLQVASYRLRDKKRIFLMAPIHHHFELKGWAEPKVTVRFWILGIVFMLASLASLKIR